MFCLNISYFAIISVWVYSQPCRKCYYHVFADPDWPHSRHTLMAIIITTSQPIRAQYSNLLTNHITVTRHQMVAVIRCWPLNHRVSIRPHLSILHSQLDNQATAPMAPSKYKHRENWNQKPALGPRVQLGDGRILTRIARDDLSICSRIVIGSQYYALYMI